MKKGCHSERSEESLGSFTMLKMTAINFYVKQLFFSSFATAPLIYH
jgi:hypothetical protein